jgi:hypothetical protein
MAHKVFKTEEPGSGETFELGGVTFHPMADAPAGILIDFVEASRAESGQVQAIIGFFEAVLPDDEVEPFQKAIRSKAHIVTIATLRDLGEWLAEMYAARPTVRQPASSGGRRTTGGSLTAVPPSAESTPEPSPPDGSSTSST